MQSFTIVISSSYLLPSPILENCPVIPAEAGIHLFVTRVDSRLRGNDISKSRPKFSLPKVLVTEAQFQANRLIIHRRKI